MFKSNRFSSGIAHGLSLLICVFLFSGCFEEQHPGTYYTFTGYSIADRLESRSEDFSEFIKALKRSGQWTELQTYGFHTCFAPYNAAVRQFLEERSIKDGVTYNSVEDLPRIVCDSLVYTHLVDITCFVGEMAEGTFPKVNLIDRYLMLSFDSKTKVEDGDTTLTLLRCINKFSHIVEKDDTCENGVIHTIDHCIDFTGNYVYDLLDNNPETSLFSQAIKYCGLRNRLNEYYDENYHVGYDSVGSASRVHLHASSRDYILEYWEKRKVGFTIFVEPDSLFNSRGIMDLDDLAEYARKVYDPIYPESAGVTDPTDPRNSLNRFISYHILPFIAGHDNFNTRKDMISMFHLKSYDPQDYFTPLAPSSMMRISTDIEDGTENVYINRLWKEGNGSTVFKGEKQRGILVLKGSDLRDVNQIAMNGMIHYIDDILVYDSNVRDYILDRRLRIDCGTLSPDFITSGARGAQPYQGSGKRSIGFKDPAGFHSFNSDYRIHLRPVDDDTYTYEGDAVDIEGLFDMYVKLPPVPHDGTWQLRVSFRALTQYCGIVQYYMAKAAPGAELTHDMWAPLGLPCDLRVELNDPNVGWISDNDMEDDDAIDALDKSMKNRSWMKGPDSQTTCNAETHRSQDHMGRLILSTEYMYANMDYYLRFKQLLDKPDAQYCFDYIELVPKSVYDNYEDKH